MYVSPLASTSLNRCPNGTWDTKKNMKIHEDNRTLSLFQWKTFQFECAHIIAESCVRLHKHMIFDHVSVQACGKKKRAIWMAEWFMGTATWTALADAAEVLEDKAGDERARGWRRGGLSSLFNMSSVSTVVQQKATLLGWLKFLRWLFSF